MNKILLHLEGLTVFALSLYFYWRGELQLAALLSAHPGA